MSHANLYVGLIENDIDTLEEDIAENIEGVASSRLNLYMELVLRLHFLIKVAYTAKGFSVSGVTERKVFRVDSDKLISYGELNCRDGCIGRVYVAPLGVVES